MSVVYEPRALFQEGHYPNLIEHDPDQDHHVQYASQDDVPVSDLPDYSQLAATLGSEDRNMIHDGISDIDLNLATSATMASLGAELPETLAPAEPLEDPESPPVTSGRSKCIPKPERDVQKQADGKYYCTNPDCTEDIRGFHRKCEWNKHMDKHERPYRCQASGCEKLSGFTYSGGLLRHEREVHGKHGGPKKTVNCPHPNCKRHTGKGFSRQENLNEHLRRVHTGDASTPFADDVASSDGDHDSLMAGGKRKRTSRLNSTSDSEDLREEVKRLRKENEELRGQVNGHSSHTLALLAQIAQLEQAHQTMRIGGLNPADLAVQNSGMSAPSAAMI